jgi:hypothetical protein
VKKIKARIDRENEFGARRAVLEDLFYDFHTKRHQVYWLNFVRGIFFGVGSVLGATIIVAIVVWVLSRLVDLPGGVGGFIQYVVDVVKSR